MPVPLGTIVSDMYTGELLAELVEHGDRWKAATGGRGEEASSSLRGAWWE